MTLTNVDGSVPVTTISFVKPSRTMFWYDQMNNLWKFDTATSSTTCYTLETMVAVLTESNRVCSFQSYWMKFDLPLSAEDKQVEGEAAYQLGLTYQRAGDTETAKRVPYCGGRVDSFPSTVKMHFKFDHLTTLSVQYYNTCMQICMLLQDADGLGRSYYAMTKCLERYTQQKQSFRVWRAFCVSGPLSFLHFFYICACVSVRETWKKQSSIWRCWLTSHIPMDWNTTCQMPTYV